MFILKVCAALEKSKVVYAIVGCYAVALHGVVRGTVDVDIAIQWNLKNLKKAEEALKGLGLVSLLPVDAQMIFRFRDEYIKKRNLIAWNFYNPLDLTQQVDLLITYNLKGAKSTKQIKTTAGTLRILNLKDLIHMKLEAGRPQDIEDVKALKMIPQQPVRFKEG
jgi:hypothetical protein